MDKKRIRLLFNLRCILFISVIFINPSFLNSQQKDLKFQHYNLEHGLSQNTIHSMYQDKTGFLWFGTERGLNRFDGFRFFTFPKKYQSSRINAIYEDKQGNCWIGTAHGLYTLGNNIEYDINKTGSSMGKYVACIAEDAAGNLWVGTLSGLSRYNRDNQTFQTISIFSTGANDQINGGINSMVFDNEGDLWIGFIEDGLCKVKFKEKNLVLTSKDSNSFDIIKTVEHFTFQKNNDESLSSNQIIKVYKDKNGSIWVGTKNQGLNKVITSNNETYKKGKKYQRGVTFKHFRSNILNSNSISNDYITAIYEDHANNFWIGTYGGGLNRFDRINEKFESFKENPANVNGLNSDYIVSIYEDKSNNLWVGTFSEGLNKYNENKNKFELIKNQKGKPETLNNNLISAIYEDKNGILWIGTRDGFNKLDRKRGTCKLFKDQKIPGTLSSNFIRTICEDKEGRLWIGTNQGGINFFDKGNELFYNQRNSADAIYDANVSIRSAIIDREQNLWVGTYVGLSKYDINRKYNRIYQPDSTNPNSLDNAYIWSILEDKSGNIFIGTNLGVNWYDIEKDNFKRIKFEKTSSPKGKRQFAISMREDLEGNIWIGTYGSGMHKLISEEVKQRDANGNITKSHIEWKEVHCPISDLSDDEVIYGILSDDNSNIWFSSNSGIWKYNPANSSLRHYTIDDGLQSNEFSTGAFFKNKNGEMFFGGDNGLNIFHPKDIIENNYTPNIVITNFKKFDSTIDITDLKEINLSYNDNYFSFEFASLDYTTPQKNKYAYMLDGFDKDWNYCGNRNFASYTNLDGGEYIFKVKGTNSDGIWNHQGTSIKIIIATAPWKTIWAYFLYVFVILGIVFGYIANRINVNKKNISMLRRHSQDIVELQDKERTRVARELHDSIIQLIISSKLKLNSFESKIPQPYNDEIKSVKSILDTASTELRRISQNLHPIILDDLGLDGGINALCREFRVRSKINTLLEISNLPKDLPSELKINIYRIVQEALNNVEKHAKANEVAIKIVFEKNQFCFSIKDNGSGFREQKNKKLDNSLVTFGLRSMRERVNFLNGEILIRSEIGKGTEILVWIPYSQNIDDKSTYDLEKDVLS